MTLSPSKRFRFLRIVTLIVIGMLTGYLLLYSLLSICGGYQRAYLASLHGVEIGYTWAPIGFYDTATGWRSRWVQNYYPLWYLDICYVHKSKLSV